MMRYTIALEVDFGCIGTFMEVSQKAIEILKTMNRKSWILTAGPKWTQSIPNIPKVAKIEKHNG